jgi:thiol:disulfide interchange protein DsbD
MDEQWHTYWKNPGASGMPTQIKWNLPDGFYAGEIQWPYPQKFESGELVSFGYEEEVFLLAEIKAPDTVKPGTKAEIAAEVNWLACKESCIPGQADLKISLPVHDKDPEFQRRWSRQFSDTRRKMPGKFGDWEISAVVKNDLVLLHIHPPSWFKSELTGIDFFPEQEGIIDLSKKQNVQKSEEAYVIGIQLSLLSGELPSRLQGVLFSEKGWSQSRREHAMKIDIALHSFE